MAKSLQEMRERVCEANKSLPVHGLVKFTWGNVSEVDREAGLIVIKPSGVDYDQLTPENMVVTDLEGNIVEGDLNPSSDLPTHVQLYKAWQKSVVLFILIQQKQLAGHKRVAIFHFMEQHMQIIFMVPVPCARSLSEDEVNTAYEKETGSVIIEEFERRNLDPMAVPGIIVRNHGPFTWGKDPAQAVYHSVVLEEVAKMNRFTEQINPRVEPAPKYIMDKHYLRKHGPNAYYGQKGQEH
ncbi:L-ribulose-5-phosphate 4-epimerase [Streptococcus agalactiae]|nr:L-ribulose-5-phosphate 4-epimerase [Streptococcus agalactiae]